MVLKYRKLDYRPWPVTVTLRDCVEATGEVVDVEQTFTAHFKPFTERDLLAFRREVFGDESDEGNKKRLAEMTVAENTDLEAEFLSRLVCGWANVKSDGGDALPFDAATLRAMCTGHDGAAFRRGINAALNQIRFGIAPAKNGATSPSPGPTPGEGEEKTISTTIAAAPG